jgi:hypothetical protein
MKRIIFSLILLAVSAAVGQSNPLDSKTTAFVGVNVIPMDKERVLQNQTVIVKNGLIAEIGDTKKIKVPKEKI